MIKNGASLLAALLAVSSSGADWPSFRGPNGSGLAETTGLPAEFGPNTNLIWKTSLPSGASSPILTKDRVFVTASSQGALLTICLDRATGATLWRREVAPHH